ncbi:MAG: glycosyltransferase family 4 protein [Limisphaerales bacterium]
MKAVFLANRTFGIVSSRLTIIRKLIDFGWDVTILANRDNTSEKLGTMGCKVIDIPFASGGFNFYKDSKSYFKLKHTLKLIRPELIHNFNAKPVILGTFLGRSTCGPKTRIVNTITGLGYAYLKGGLTQYVSNLAYSKLLDSADLNIFQNDSDKNRFVSSKFVSSKKAITIVSSGVDIRKFKPNPVASLPKEITIVFVGRLLWQKGIREFLEAATRLKKQNVKLKFLVYGELAEKHPDGVPKNYLDQFEKQSIARINGFTDNIENVYSNCNLLVFPSYYGEGVPRVVLEAAACGIPAVVCQAGWVNGVVLDGETGFVVEPKSPNAIVNAVQKFLDNRELFIKMGQKAATHVKENFDQKNIVEKYMQIYEQFSQL